MNNDRHEQSEWRSACERTQQCERVAKIKADAGKPRVSLVPMEIVRNIAAVREYGVAKYGERESWREVSAERYVDALGRHALSFLEDPQGLDAESGLPHLWHLACNAAFLCELSKEGN